MGQLSARMVNIGHLLTADAFGPDQTPSPSVGACGGRAFAISTMPRYNDCFILVLSFLSMTLSTTVPLGAPLRRLASELGVGLN